jgi:inosine-uridine nucleoside N-ribohydrolase
MALTSHDKRCGPVGPRQSLPDCELSKKPREVDMAEKVVLIADPGIDGAFAIALALFDPELEVLGLGATAGNVSAEQATQNVHIVVDRIDPPRSPRLGEAVSVDYDMDGRSIHGPKGLGNTDYLAAVRHNLPTTDKLIGDLARQNPGEVTVICLGPLTAMARAIDLSPELPTLVKRLVVVGGSHHEPGNAGPVSEFHFACDPAAAKSVLRTGAPITLIPLDLSRKVLFSPKDLLDEPADSTPCQRFLREIVPYGLSATANTYGIEGFHLKDVLAVVAVAAPNLIETKHHTVDVETRGELTRGMMVVDQRGWMQPTPNVDLAIHVDGHGVRDYINRILRLRG